MKVVFILFFLSLLLPFKASNQNDSIRNARTIENIEHYKRLVMQTRREVDSLLNRLPELVVSEDSKKVSKKINKAVKETVKAHKSLKNLTVIETGIPSIDIPNNLEIKSDTLDYLPILKKEYKKPFFKRIFKQRKNKKK